MTTNFATADDFYQAVSDACRDGSRDSAVAVSTAMTPANADGMVKPPTFAKPVDPQWGKYHVFQSRHPQTGEMVRTVLLDSVASQANRWEAAVDVHNLVDDLGLPILAASLAVGTVEVDVSTFTAPHSASDAYWREAVYPDGHEHAGRPFLSVGPGWEIRSSRPKSASGLFRRYPTALVKGWMFSFSDVYAGTEVIDTNVRRGAKHISAPHRDASHARILTSTIFGYDPTPSAPQPGTKGDPTGFASLGVTVAKDGTRTVSAVKGKGKEAVMSNYGFGAVPHGGKPEKAAWMGVSVASILRSSTLSFGGLRDFQFGTGRLDRNIERDTAGRTVIALLALLGDSWAQWETHLRSGCDLNIGTPTYTWQAGGQPDREFTVTDDVILGAYHQAVKAAATHGVEFGGDLDLNANQFLIDGFTRTLDLVGDVTEDESN